MCSFVCCNTCACCLSGQHAAVRVTPEDGEWELMCGRLPLPCKAKCKVSYAMVMLSTRGRRQVAASDGGTEFPRNIVCTHLRIPISSCSRSTFLFLGHCATHLWQSFVNLAPTPTFTKVEHTSRVYAASSLEVHVPAMGNNRTPTIR